MLDQAFSSKNLIRLCRKADVPTFRMNFKHLEGAANALSSAIKTGSFVPTPFSHRKTKGFTIYSTVDYANILALRKINDTIRRLYRIKQSDRSAIVRQVSLLLERF